MKLSVSLERAFQSLKMSQAESVGLNGSEHLGGRKSLMKNVIELHYEKCKMQWRY